MIQGLRYRCGHAETPISISSTALLHIEYNIHFFIFFISSTAFPHIAYYTYFRVYQKTKNISDHLALLVCFVTMISKNCPKKLDHSDQN